MGYLKRAEYQKKKDVGYVLLVGGKMRLKDIELKENMTIVGFKKYAEKHDTNLVTKWDYNSFKIQCQKCNSFNVRIVDDIVHNFGSDCPTCGYDSSTRGLIIIKCIDCGNGMQILDMIEVTEAL